MTTRRSFLIRLATLAGIAPLAPKLLAQKATELEESDPTAQALGYRKDTAQVDGKKYPMHKPENKCSGCVLYTGKPGEAKGPCSAFANKLVTEKGWCMAFAKKP